VDLTDVETCYGAIPRPVAVVEEVGRCTLFQADGR